MTFMPAQQALYNAFFREKGASTYAVDPATNPDHLFMLTFWVSTFFFVLLMALMVYFVVKYRRRPGVPVERSPSHHTWLEITWTVVPSLILVVIFFEGFWGYMHQVVVPGHAETIHLNAKKWSWQFTYNNGGQSSEFMQVGLTETPVFVVPDDRPIKLLMKSDDVIHAFWVPDFRGKFDVFPNRYTVYWFQAQPLNGASERLHWVFCAEYCGDSHSEMAAILKVVPGPVYDEWKAKAGEPSGTPAERGAVYFKTKGCNACHSVDGAKNRGPTWLNMMGHPAAFTDGSSIEARDETYILESIRQPGKRIVAGFNNEMPPQALSDDEILCLIAYMHTLSDRGTPQVPAAPANDPPAGEGGAP